jgi:ArsR family transcriptional regulator, arsenate/arsenite/antimonite-responsive transcriptional repressor
LASFLRELSETPSTVLVDISTQGDSARKDVVHREFDLVGETPNKVPEPGEIEGDERVARLVALGRALSDPIRVRMIGMLADVSTTGRGCCGLPDLGAPVNEEDENIGICISEFEDCFGMSQSRVSYHIRRLKEARMVREEKRGKWSFYSLNGEAAQELLTEAGDLLFLLMNSSEE